MATVRNTITLQDKMTPVLRNVIKALQTTVNALSGVDHISDNAFSSMKKDVDNAIEAVNRLEYEIKDIDPTPVEKGFSAWKNPLVSVSAGIYTIKSAIQGLSKTTKFIDDFTLGKSRLDLMNDGLQTTHQLQNMILASANRARGVYQDTGQVVAKLGILAKDSFSSAEEIVAFSELINKSFKIGGASIQEQKSAMYQLTQAMASGKLQGDEFRAIMENAPLLAEAIAIYTGKSKGELKEMSSQGLITSDIIKGAMFNMAEEINAKFEQMPRTFGDMWNLAINYGIKAFEPVLVEIGKMINTAEFEQFIVSATQGLVMVANGVLHLINIIKMLATFIIANWALIEPILYAIGFYLGIMATQMLYLQAVALATQAPMLLGWLQTNWALMLLIGTLALIVSLWNEVDTTGKILLGTIGAIVSAIVIWITVQKILNAVMIANPIGLIVMAVATLISIIIGLVVWIMNLWKTNMSFKYGIIGIWHDILGFFESVPLFFRGIGNGITDAFIWANLQVQNIMQGMANSVIDTINGVINAINAIPGVSIEPLKQMTFASENAVREEAKKQLRDKQLQQDKDNLARKHAEREAKLNRDRAEEERRIANDIAKAEAEKKKNENLGLESYLNNMPKDFNFEQFKNGLGNTTIDGGNLDSVGSIKDDVSITDEDIKLIKDLAMAQFVNKYTTLRPELNVTFGDVHEKADTDELLDTIEEMLVQAYASSLDLE